MKVQGNLQNQLDGYNLINVGIVERCRILQSVPVEFVNKIQEDVTALNKPIGYRNTVYY